MCQFTLSLKPPAKLDARLLIVCDTKTFTDGKDFSMLIPMNLFYGEVAKYFSSVTFCSPVSKTDLDRFGKGYVALQENLHFAPRPFWTDVEAFFRKAPYILIPTLICIIREIVKNDIVLLRLPSPTGFLTWVLCRLCGKPVIIHLRGTWERTVREGNALTSVKKIYGLTAMHVLKYLRDFMMKRNPCLVHDEEILKRLGHTTGHDFLRITVGLISEKEFYERDNSCSDSIIRLLFVGRLSPAKGCEYLVEALTSLPQQVELIMVGDGMMKKNLQEKVQKAGLQNRVYFKGHIAFGEGLFREYKDADIFILPSLSEGFPKCLLEAASFGLPIVATKVGGIPDIIDHKDSGLLIEPRSVAQITEAVTSILEDSKLRRKLIQGGYQTARKFTLEKTANRYAGIVQRIYLNSSKSVKDIT